MGDLIVASVVGYLVGTVPSADVAARLATRGDVDLRRVGSGNPGALNAMAHLGKVWGVAVLIADTAKGALAATAGRAIAGDRGAYLGATAAIAGHIAPVWNGFRGGKGVATSAGACLAVFPPYFVIDVAVAGLSAAKTQSAETTVQISSILWVAASALWWRRRLPNGWGPDPSGWLIVFAAVSSAMIVAKFASSRRVAGHGP